MPSLRSPVQRAGASNPDLLSYPAVQLFVERARAVEPEFELNKPVRSELLGMNSQISVVDPASGRHHPLVSGLFSTVFGAVGPIGVEGISVRHNRVLAILGLNSRLFDSIDCSTQPPDCPAVADAAVHQSGQLISVSEKGTWRPVAPLGRLTSTSSPSVLPKIQTRNTRRIRSVSWRPIMGPS